MITTLRRIILPADPAVSRRVFTLAFPIILGNLSRVLMNVVDVAFQLVEDLGNHEEIS